MTTITNSILTSEERRALFSTWRSLYASGNAVALDFLIYALLRGKDPRAGFTPISNTNQLNNGSTADQCYKSTLLTASNMAGHRMSEKVRTLFPGMSAERNAEVVGAIWNAATALYYGKKEA